MELLKFNLDLTWTKGRGGDTFHISRYHLSHVSAKLCNSTLQYSAVQHCSRLVHQRNTKRVFLTNQAKELTFCNKHWRYKNCSEKRLSSYVLILTNLGKF